MRMCAYLLPQKNLVSQYVLRREWVSNVRWSVCSFIISNVGSKRTDVHRSHWGIVLTGASLVLKSGNRTFMLPLKQFSQTLTVSR